MLKRISACLVFASVPLLGLASTSRTIEATFVAVLSEIPAGTPRIKVWVPVPGDTDQQTIRDLRIESPHRWQLHSESEFGNGYLYAEIEKPADGMELLTLRFMATRQEISFRNIKPVAPSSRELRRNLRPDRLVTVSPRVRNLAREITSGNDDPLAQARAIYDHVLMTMKYDKTTPGWGHGDTERACDIRTGNCTDFHSLFISLARAVGIPARFVMGFSMTGSSGQTSGYHCWAEFYVQGRGWIPVDPSEASKSPDPARRAYLFGNLDADRLQFTVGRDIELTPPTSEPLNYFIYPHAELQGEEVGRPIVSFGFRDLEVNLANREAGTR